MLLRIIDIPATKNTENAVRVVLEKNKETESFITESYTSPITDNFRKTLAWYFKDYIHSVMTDDGDSGIVEKLINFGQYLGDELLGEDHQMIKLKKDIEQQGYKYLRVQIESERLEFFNEYWEIAILFESKYVLSAVVRGFARLFVSPNGPVDFPELRYNLHAIPPSPELAHLFADSASPMSDLDPQPTDKHQPLRMLVWVSRPESMELAFASSDTINMTLDAAAAGGVFDIDACFNGDWVELTNHFNDREKPVHIFHYDGPVIIKSDKVYFTTSHNLDELIPLEALAQHLVAYKVGALSVDARIYLKDNQQLAASEGLACIAQVAQQQGLGNVIGLGYITNPWFSQICFQSIYTQIARGFSLEQAVVEARKMLQKQPETALMTTQPIPFHWWSLLVHYGAQSVIFFEAPQMLVEDKANPVGLHHINAKLFGFNTDLLPPLFRCVSDGQALTVIEILHQAWRGGRAEGVAIHGEAGSGKTQLAHLICAYLAQKSYMDFAFYFNFSKYQYTRGNILEMIAPVINMKPGDFTAMEKSINQRRCCFVFDQLISAEINHTEAHASYWADLRSFIQSLITAGHNVLFVSEKETPLQILATHTVMLSPLLPAERAILAAKKLHSFELKHVANDKDWIKLIKISQGNPWLLNKAIPLLSLVNTQDLTENLEHLFNSQQIGSIKHKFYEWQWTGLAPASRTLLKLFGSVNGILLEMLLTVAHQPQVFAPVKALFDRLDCEPNQLSSYFDHWYAAGFVRRIPLGRLLDLELYDFLESKYLDPAAKVNESELSFLFHQWLCEAIRLLAQHLGKNPNISLSNYLVHQRRQWVRAFESLWFKQDYRGFISVKNAFDELLQQAKLTAESTAWSMDLLKRSPVVLPRTQFSNETITRDGQFAWLALAIEALRQTEAKETECILVAAEQWRAWVNDLTDSLNQTQLTLFQQVTIFLEAFYQSREQWHDCLAIAEKAHLIYTEYQAWHKVIRTLKSLATYSYKLGETEQTFIFENKIIHDIPYTEAPPGFKIQNLMDILFARISRSDTQAAQALLDDLRKEQDAEKLSEVLDGVQCDIYYQQENYLAALPHYARLWCRALAAQQHTQLIQLKSRLVDIEKKIGSKVFNIHFSYETPEGTIKPIDYVSNLH